MSLGAVLVDRARVLRQAAQPTKIEGRTQFGEIEEGTWFDCRLFMPTSPESYDPANVRRRIVIVPTMLYGTDDDDGEPVRILASDKVQIESDDLGNATWQVTAQPEPLRRKTGILGYQVTLRRIDNPEFAPKD